jgi:hypothetical protein
MKTLASFLAATIAFLPSVAFADDIPETLVGLWAPSGQCDAATGPVYVGLATLQFAGQDVPDPVAWYESYGPSGNGAIHWAEDVSNFEYDPSRDILLYNEQGNGMGIVPVIYERCDN